MNYELMVTLLLQENVCLATEPKHGRANTWFAAFQLNFAD